MQFHGNLLIRTKPYEFCEVFFFFPNQRIIYFHYNITYLINMNRFVLFQRHINTLIGYTLCVTFVLVRFVMKNNIPQLHTTDFNHRTLQIQAQLDALWANVFHSHCLF